MVKLSSALILAILVSSPCFAVTLHVTAEADGRVCFNDLCPERKHWGTVLDSLFGVQPGMKVLLDLPQEYSCEDLEELIFALRTAGENEGRAAFRLIWFRCQIGGQEYETSLLFNRGLDKPEEVPPAELDSIHIPSGSDARIVGEWYQLENLLSPLEILMQKDRFRKFLLSPEPGCDYFRLCLAISACKEARISRISLWGKNTSFQPRVVTSWDETPKMPGPPKDDWKTWRVEVDEPPTIVLKAVVYYPEAARSLGLQGDVYITVKVNEKGKAVGAHLARGDPPEILVKEAIRSAMRCSFSPAMRDGKPVKSIIVIPFEFKIREKGP